MKLFECRNLYKIRWYSTSREIDDETDYIESYVIANNEHDVREQFEDYETIIVDCELIEADAMVLEK